MSVVVGFAPVHDWLLFTICLAAAVRSLVPSSTPSLTIQQQQSIILSSTETLLQMVKQLESIQKLSGIVDNQPIQSNKQTSLTGQLELLELVRWFV